MNLKLVLIILFLLGAIGCSNGTFRNPKKIYIGWCTFFILLSPFVIILKMAFRSD